MVQKTRHLLIGSIEPYSGKTGVIVGMAHQLKSKGLAVSYAKPVGTCFDEQTLEKEEADVRLMAEVLELSPTRIGFPLVYLSRETISKRLQNEDTKDYLTSLVPYMQSIEGDLVLIEGSGSLDEGILFGLSLAEIAEKIEAAVLLVTRGNFPPSIDSLLKAKQELGERLIGVVLNNVVAEQIDILQSTVKPFLAKNGIPVLGVLPQSALLASVSVREITQQLKAQVLCRSDRLDLMVESLMIGAMNVNAALEYFSQKRNKAVVTGSDRTDLHFAALETSTSCLILTGTTPPDPILLSRAEDLEVPVLAVNLDTLKTIETIKQTFGKVRLQEDIKVRCVQELMEQYFDFDRLLEQLNVNQAS